MLVLSLFASTIGPFGGFFASGLKRSIKIKDFLDLELIIPIENNQIEIIIFLE